MPTTDSAVETIITPAWLTGPSSTSFYTVTYAAVSPDPKGLLLFVHGFAEHIRRYDQVFCAWAARGFGVFAYDQRGFGRTALDEKHKSKDSKYGKTSLDSQLEDVKWAAGEAKKKWPGVPLFLMGYSMVGCVLIILSKLRLMMNQGGATALTYCTQVHDVPFAGVLAIGPLLHQTKPASQVLRFVGGIIAYFLPHMSFPAEVKSEVCTPFIKVCRN
jgi:acylglycerol lipase